MGDFNSGLMDAACPWTDSIVESVQHNLILRLWGGLSVGPSYSMLQQVAVQTAGSWIANQMGLKQMVSDLTGCTKDGVKQYNVSSSSA